MVVAMVALQAPSFASAQEGRTVFPGPTADPDRDALAQARDLFLRGTTDAQAERWADALNAFSEAYRISGIAAALFNAATTLRSIGRYVDARDAFDQLLRDHPDLSEEMAASARDLRQELVGRVAILEVRDLPPDTATVRLDGTLREDDGARPLEVEVDAGRHALQIELPEFQPFLWEGAVRDGERREIRVVLEALPVIEPESNVLKIVLWTVVGALVIGGAVTLGLVLREDGLSPESDSVVRL